MMNNFDNLVCKSCNGTCKLIELFDTETAKTFNQSVVNVLYKKKETLIKQNSLTTHFFYIKSGLVKIFTERRNDKNILLQIVTPGNFLGITHLLSNSFNYSAMAVQDAEVCIIPKIVILEAMQINEKLRNYLFFEQGKQSHFFIDKISSLGTKQMHGRLADAILYLSREEFSGTKVFESITRKDIAEMSGMSSESAIRLLTEFKNDGLIKSEGKKIEINNHELIHRLSEIG